MINKLSYIPKNELIRILSIEVSKLQKAELISLISRINTLYMINKAGSGHIGTSFSSMDLLSYIFLNFQITNAKNEDLFFSSKGHDAPGIYSIMSIFDLIDFDTIHNLRMLNGLPGHPDIETPGIITNTGSLGMGISKAKGFINSARLQNVNRNVIVLLGDGELQEGQIWEAAMSATKFKSNNLIAIIDFNKVAQDNITKDLKDIEPIEAKWESFGWDVQRIDGHNMDEIIRVLQKISHQEKPRVIIADTIKGKGVSFMEGQTAWHGVAPSKEDYEKALKELE